MAHKSVVSVTHEQNIICSKTHLDSTTHEQTFIKLFAHSYVQVMHMVGIQPMKKKGKMHQMITSFIYPSLKETYIVDLHAKQCN